MVAQGELWLMETPAGKNRPALVVTRDEAIGVLDNLLVAPVTTAIRNIPTCIAVGRREGLHSPSVASFDNLSTVHKSLLKRRLGALAAGGRRQICEALRAAAAC